MNSVTTPSLTSNRRRFLLCATPLAGFAASFLAPAAVAQVAIGPVNRAILDSAFVHHPLNSNYGGQDSDANQTSGQWIGSGVQGPSVGDESGHGTIAAIVSQQSDVTTTRLWVAQGVSVDIASAGSGSADVDARSSYSVTFTVSSTQVANVSLDFEGTGGLRGATLMPPSGPALFNTSQDLETTLTLAPGTYTLTSQVSFAAHCGGSCAHIVNPRVNMEILFTPAPPPACPADLGSQGGLPGGDNQLNNNDFVVFIDHFFNHDPRADLGRQGGLVGGDSLFDNNDFVVFIDEFFGGCA